MAGSLLLTKLHIPSPRPQLVSRPRLVERLGAGLNGKLTLISAPAGYGKTTLLSEWIHRGDENFPAVLFAWVSLDDRDNHVVRFWRYVVAALQAKKAGLGQIAQAMLQSAQPASMETTLTALINDVTAAFSVPPAGSQEKLVLVLDDYHTIVEPAIHDAVGFLVNQLPSQMHVVIAARQDPPLPLSRLRGRGQLTEIRQGDLKFTPGEAETFLNQCMGLNLATSEVGVLEDRTEGWIAGLQLAALSLHSLDAESADRLISGFSGRHHFVLDYLTDEVLRRQPETVQRFLLETSVLERMSGPLCDALTGTSGESKGLTEATTPVSPLDPGVGTSGQSILEYLEHANLFLVPLDGERRWYRYHRLFAELLRVRLRQAEPDQVPTLHRRAARWFELDGLPFEAVHHALATQDLTFAADVIERATQEPSVWANVDAATLAEWFGALPDDVMRARPTLWLLASRALYVAGEQEAGESTMRELEQHLREGPSTPDAERILGRVVADRASYAAVRGDVREAIGLAHQAMERLPADNPAARVRVAAILGLAHFRAGEVSEAEQAFSRAITAATAAGVPFAAVPFVCFLVEVHRIRGQLRQATRMCERAIQMSTVDGKRSPAAGFAELGWGKLLYERDELEAAERHVLSGLELLSSSGTSEGFGNGHAILAQIRQARGDGEGALSAIQRATEIAQGSGIQRLSVLISAYRARIWLAQGRLDLAARWAREYRDVGATEYLREVEDLTLVRVLLGLRQLAEALALLEALLSPAEHHGRIGRVIEMLALKALALHAQGAGGPAESEALGPLARSLALAEPEGYVRVFVGEGEATECLLRQARAQGIATGYVDRLLAVLASHSGGEAPPARQPAPPGRAPSLVEPLTGREMEVLQLLGDGLSNAEIAQQLYISLPTVKSHARNIYGKLGVHRRRQAVARARALGILPSP